MSVTRSTARLEILLTAVPLALACGLALSGCRSTPSKPDPDPGQGKVVLLGNDSSFAISVGAGLDCRDSRLVEPADSDFSPVHLEYDLSCSAEASGEAHSGNMAVEGAVIWTLDGPDNSPSEVRMVMEAVGNRSRTGLSSSSAVLRPRFRFEVTGKPVAYHATGSINYVDSFPDFFLLRRAGSPQGSELFSEYGQGFGEAGSLSLNESGTLVEGTYEVWVELSTQDWFTEDLTLVLRFGDVE